MGRPLLQLRTHNALPSACISLCVYLWVSQSPGSPPCPVLLVWIIRCPFLAARLCAPWIYDGDGWPGLRGIGCVCMCQWGQGRHGCPTKWGDTRLFTAGWTSVMDMEIRQYLGNKSLSVHACLCVCGPDIQIVTDGCSFQHQPLLQGQTLYGSPSSLSTYSDTCIQ